MPTITIHQCAESLWTAVLPKGGPVLIGQGHADAVLVEIISRAAKSRESCLEAAKRKASRLGYPSPAILGTSDASNIVVIATEGQTPNENSRRGDR